MSSNRVEMKVGRTPRRFYPLHSRDLAKEGKGGGGGGPFLRQTIFDVVRITTNIL